MPYHFVLISDTPQVSQADLYKLARVLEVNARDCAQAWGLRAPAIDVGTRRAKLPPGTHPVVFIDGSHIDDSGLAYHYYDPVS